MELQNLQSSTSKKIHFATAYKNEHDKENASPFHVQQNPFVATQRESVRDILSPYKSS